MPPPPETTQLFPVPRRILVKSILINNCTGSMRPELHGEVPQDEPTDIAALPGVPDGRQ